ncbi:MAG: type VI secretion system tube protein Hcp [Burkholderiales bacterium]|nr:type VI secretion system tube protein Hcp [Burkholderiales bacterium]MDE2504629.1 type VI secretion system tube protein Hcp [Burkholderiales bacterium]
MARSDMFFKATGQRSGEVAGESIDKTFGGQIDVVEWSWGMQAPSAVSGQRTGRVSLGELRLVKRVDKASTSLMAIMNNNELLTTATLTVRKSGGAALPYVVVKLEKARINAYDVHSSAGADGEPVLTEHLALSFAKITFDYVPQTTTGGGGGGSSFTGMTGPD